MGNKGIDKLLFSGAITNGCVESTVRAAFDLGYLPTVIEDACVAPDKKFHESSLRCLQTFFANILTTEDVLTLLK